VEPTGQGPTEGTVPSATRRRVVHSTLRDAVADEIRHRVFSAQLLPGTRVDQERLAQDLGVSRVPVREALITLHDEGTIENVAHRGAFVADLSRDDIHDHYRLLGLVSGLAAERAARMMTEQEIAGLRELAIRMESVDALREEDALNFEFHRRINRAAGSRRLASVLNILVKAIPTVFYETHSLWPAKAHGDHRRIVEALAARRSDQARRATERHFADGGARAVDYLEHHGFWGTK
jgi:DNA-binding GntR family transcriptional regulator